MSFQNIILPGLLVEDLYRNVLVLPPRDENGMISEVIPARESVGIKFLGNNLKHIVIVVNEPAEVFLQEKHLEFLSKILAACKLNIGDVAIVNEGHKFADIATIKKELRPHCIILFGLEPTDLKLPLNFPHFKIQNYDDVAYLSVPALEILNVDNEEGKLLKTRLWVCLKTMFEVQNGS
jgi:hypothetical protein